jgi:hypothetical protein
MVQGARATRDRVNDTARSMRRIATNAAAKEIVGRAAVAVGWAKDAARAAKDAARLARRMQQYGSLDQVRAAFGAAQGASAFAAQAEAVVNAYHEAVRVAANPDPDPEAQKLLLDKAETNADLAAAQLAADTAPGDRALADALDAAKEAAAVAQANFLEGILSGVVRLERTQWPNCPKDGAGKGVFPRSVTAACRRRCYPGTFVLRYVRPDKKGCAEVEEPKEVPGVKGKEREPLAPGETSDERTVRAPEVERHFPARTGASGARHPGATVADDAVEREQEQRTAAPYGARLRPAGWALRSVPGSVLPLLRRSVSEPGTVCRT